MTLDEAERQAHIALDALRREYERQAAPYIEILCRIHAMRPPTLFVPIRDGMTGEVLHVPLPNSHGSGK